MRRLRVAAVLLGSIGLATGGAPAAPPLVTVRVTSINALLKDIETLSASAQSPTTRKQLLAQLGLMLGVEDVSFLDLTRPAAVALPQEGMTLGLQGLVIAVPVRDGARELEVLATQYSERTVENNLTVLRGRSALGQDADDAEDDEESVEGPPTYAVVRGGTLVFGGRADLVRQFDQASALSAEGLPPGTVAFTMEVEPVAPLLNAWLSNLQQTLLAMPSPSTAPPAAVAAPAQGSSSVDGAPSAVADAADAPIAGVSALPFDPKQMAKMLDLQFGMLHDSIDALSKLQVSLELADGFVIVHARGVARQPSPLASFIAAQRDTGLPAVGRMMPIDASVIAAGQIHWTDASRAWMRQFSQRYQTAMADMINELPEAQRESGRMALRAMQLWSSDAITGCMRGDIAFAMDKTADTMSTLQVSGVSDSPECARAFESVVSSDSGPASSLKKDVIEPENLTTYTYDLAMPTLVPGAETPTGSELKMRVAKVGSFIISGTDPWAMKAIREAAGARDASAPGGGGLLLTDLGPFTQRPGVFGRVQVGTMMRQADSSEPRQPGAAGFSSELIRALEGSAGAVPFAMRFDEGAATAEFAVPLAMLDAFATHSPAPDAEADEEPEDTEDEP